MKTMKKDVEFASDSYFYTILSAILLSGLLFCHFSVHAATKLNSEGIEFDVTRVIYPEKNKNGVILKIYNRSNKPFLLQSVIKKIDLNTGLPDLNNQLNQPMPFVVTPPLTRFEANSQLDLRIRRNAQSLPQDRESVYFITMRAIPAENRSQDKKSVSMAVVMSMKLFWRPHTLQSYAISKCAPKLHFVEDVNVLTAKNPTPYWLTFSALKVGDYSFSNDALRIMVPPAGEQQYRLPFPVKGEVTWQLMDEDGWKTEWQKQQL